MPVRVQGEQSGRSTPHTLPASNLAAPLDARASASDALLATYAAHALDALSQRAASSDALLATYAAHVGDALTQRAAASEALLGQQVAIAHDQLG